MKRFFKCAVSLVLVLVMSCGVVLQTSAASQQCNCGEEPIVYVAALGSATLYQNAGTEDEKVIFRPETMTYVKLIAKLLIPLVSVIVTKDYDAFADKLIPAVADVFGPLANAENGDSTADITTKEELPTDPTHGFEYSYYFGYDFRADPLVIAKDLDAYIDHVLELTGHEKVRLRASSMGGVMTMAYFEQFGCEKVKSVIFQNCPISGTAVAGDLYCGRLEINEDSLYRYGATALPTIMDEGLANFLMILISGLKYSGILGALIDAVNRVVDNCAGRVFDELLIPVFKANCGIWSFVPDEYYLDAKAFMLGDNPNEELEARIDYYHYNVQCKAGEILNGVLDSGVPVMIVSAYGVQRTPLVPTWHNDSDGTVDLKYSSVGATAAYLGESLGEGYVQKVNDGHNHISPDNHIDASTCALPDNTWFVKDMMHCTTHDGHGEFYRWFFENDDNADINVYTNKDYPQFLQNDIPNQKLVPQE
ncbi:MAG: hypothetical protein IKK49_01355 [Clostridia bacterium]|nr:hypothetical protein [Clostridia bacterium]